MGRAQNATPPGIERYPLGVIGSLVGMKPSEEPVDAASASPLADGAEQTITTRTAVVSLRADGIVVLCATADQDQKDALENVEAVSGLSAGRPLPLLVDLRSGATADGGARRHYATDTRTCPAQALLVGNGFTRIVANLFVKVSRPSLPTRMFNVEEDAVHWLRGFLKP